MAARRAEPIRKIEPEQRRRADNQIWNAAGMYDFTPQLRAYDAEGNAQLYWNSIIGAVEKHYGEKLDPLWEVIHNAIAEDLCGQLVWLGLENACFEREARLRPAFPILRRAYALEILEKGNVSLPEPYATAYRLHFERAAGLTDETDAGDNPAAEILTALEFSGDMSAEEIVQAALSYLDQRTLLLPRIPEAETGKWRIHLPFRRKNSGTEQGKKPKSVRGFGAGIGEYAGAEEDAYVETGKHYILDMSQKQSEAAISEYVHHISGMPIYSEAEMKRIEQTLCRGDHEDCKLWIVRGDDHLDESVEGYAGMVRRKELQQMRLNYAYYDVHRAQARNAVNQLAERWRNAFLTYRQDNTVTADYGKLRGGRVWRAETMDDHRIFDHVIPADDGDFYIDILIDGSLSQEERQMRVALQGYIIAEALTRCNIPVRVSSFYSISGYTVLTRYRDYHETDCNEQIFHYTTLGGNRDGLAFRLMNHLMETGNEHPEHRILLVLSDARPNDAIFIPCGGRSVPYKDKVSVENTAKEIRFLRSRGVAVLCVYTGTDEDLLNAHTIYNRDFVRIRSLDHFAQSVGNLVLTQLRG